MNGPLPNDLKECASNQGGQKKMNEVTIIAAKVFCFS